MNENEPRLRTWLQAFNDRDLETYLGYYHEDVLLHGYGPEPFNKKNVRGYYETMFDHFDMDSVVEDVMWDGERNAFRWRMKARQRKPFMDIEPSGKWVEQVGLSTLHWQGGQIVERYSVLDMLAFTEKLRA
jgi:predicted ester cyclase